MIVGCDFECVMVMVIVDVVGLIEIFVVCVSNFVEDEVLMIVVVDIECFCVVEVICVDMEIF